MVARPARRWPVRTFWSLLVLLGLVGLCVTWLFTADLGVFKPQLENLVSERLGREFSIEGELDIHLGRNLEVSAEKIVLENAAWVDGPAMLVLGRAAARVNLWSLFAGPTIVELVDIDNLTLNLAASESNENNWTFAPAEIADKPATQDEPLSLLLQALEIDDVHIVYADAHRPEPIDIRIQSLRQQQRDDDMLETSVDAVVNGREIELRSTLGTWASLQAGRNIQFDANGRLGSLTVEAKGLIDDLRKPSRPVIDFRLTGPSVADISSMLGFGEVGEGDIDLAGSLAIDKAGPLTLRLEGHLGQTRVDATGSASAIDDLRNVDIVMDASGPSLGQVLSYFGVDRVSDAPFEIALNLRKVGAALTVGNLDVTFGDSLFAAKAEVPDFPALTGATASIDFSGPRIEHLRYLLGIPGIATGPFHAQLDVREDELGKPALRTTIQTNLGKLVARGVVGDPPQYAGSKIDFELDAPSLRQLGQIAGITPLPDQQISARGSIVRQDGRLELDGPLLLQTDSVVASVSGAIHLGSGLLGTALQIEANGADLRDTLRRFDLDAGIPPVPYTTSGAVSFAPDGIDLQNVAVKLGTSTVELDGLIGTRKGLAGTRVRINGTGPSMEELFSGLDNIRISPGAFETAATVSLSESEILVQDFKVDRERGHIGLNARIGKPLSSHRLELDLDASGPDVRSLFNELGGFEPESTPFRINALVKRDGGEWSFKPLRATLGIASVEARGQLTLEQQSVSGSLRIESVVPDLASHGRYKGKTLKQLPLHLSATLSGEGDRFVLDDLAAVYGDSTVAGKVSYRIGPVPDLEISLQSESLNAMSIFEETDSKPAPPPEDGRVIPSIDIPFALLRTANATIGIEIGELQRNDFRAKDLRFQGTLRDGMLAVETLDLQTRDGSISASGRLVALEKGGQARLRLSADKLAMNVSSDNPIRADVDLDILAVGANLRELAASANGFFVLQAAAGDFRKSATIDLFYGNFAEQLLTKLNPFTKSGDIAKLDCAVVVLHLVDGLVQGRPAAYAQTDTARILADEAVVDLKTEKIKIGFATIPKKGVSFVSFGEVVNPYLGIQGTLGRPEIRLDQKSAVIAGGAAAATGGLSILAKGLWDRMKGAGDACIKAVDYANEALKTAANQDNP
jgi:hypothetical protein